MVEKFTMSKNKTFPIVLIRLLKNADVLTFVFIEKIGNDKYEYIEVIPYINGLPTLPLTTAQLASAKVESCRFSDISEVNRKFIKEDSVPYFKYKISLKILFQVKKLYVARYGEINPILSLNELR